MKDTNLFSYDVYSKFTDLTGKKAFEYLIKMAPNLKL